MRTRLLILSAIAAVLWPAQAWAVPTFYPDPSPPVVHLDASTFDVGYLAPVRPAAEPAPAGPVASLPVPSPLTPAPEDRIPTLPGAPSALFLGLFGLVCVGFVKGRRRLAGVVVALFAVCQAGLGALPRAIAGHGRAAVQAPVSGPGSGDEIPARPAGVTSDVDFVGLLRRLGTKGGDAAAGYTAAWPIGVEREPAVRAAQARSSAGFSWRAGEENPPVALFPSGAAVRPGAVCINPPRPARIALPSIAIPFARFARPPPDPL